MNTDERKCLSSVHPSGVMTGVDQSSSSGTVHPQYQLNMYILLTALHIFLMLLVGRFCLKIKAFHLW